MNDKRVSSEERRKFFISCPDFYARTNEEQKSLAEHRQLMVTLNQLEDDLDFVKYKISKVHSVPSSIGEQNSELHQLHTERISLEYQFYAIDRHLVQLEYSPPLQAVYNREFIKLYDPLDFSDQQTSNNDQQSNKPFLPRQHKKQTPKSFSVKSGCLSASLPYLIPIAILIAYLITLKFSFPSTKDSGENLSTDPISSTYTSQIISTAPTRDSAPRYSIKFISYPQVTRRNEDVSVKIKGAPNTKYSISVYYSSGPATADGLESKYSDSKGYVKWDWHVGGKTNPGTFTITVSGDGQSESVNFTVLESY